MANLKDNAMIKNIAKDVMAYAICLALVIVTPFLAKPLAACFDWCYLKWTSPGSLRFFFQELFTVLFWLAEITALFLLKGKINSTAQSEKELAVTDAQTQEKRILPLKNVGILLLITSVCILIISAQIGFKVKLAYELGEKMTLSQLVGAGGTLLKNIVKCGWILAAIRLSLRIFEKVFKDLDIEDKRKKLFQWLCVAGMALVFCVVDVLVFKNPFVWTYLLFYLAFVAIYYFTEQHLIKSYLLIFFIYVF